MRKSVRRAERRHIARLLCSETIYNCRVKNSPGVRCTPEFKVRRSAVNCPAVEITYEGRKAALVHSCEYTARVRSILRHASPAPVSSVRSASVFRHR